MYGDVVITGCTTTHLIIMSKTPLLPLHNTNAKYTAGSHMSHGFVIVVCFPGLARPSVAFIHMASPINKPGYSLKFNHSFTAQNIHLATRYSIHKYRCDMRGYCWCEEKLVILCYLGQLVHRRHCWCPTLQQSPLGAGDILWQLILVFWDQEE